MPQIDMTIEVLKTYMGSSPKPEDFDAFWDASIEAAKDCDANVTITDADFKIHFAKCQDLFFTALDGARIHAKLIMPQNVQKPVPTLLKFHGYTGSSGDWTDHLDYVAAGYAVVAIDVRGQGGISEDIGGTTGTTLNGHIVKGLDDMPEKLFYRNVFLDMAQLAWIVMEMENIDEANVSTYGGSQGGALSLICASLVPEIHKCVTINPFLSDYKRVWEMDRAEGAYEGLRNYFRKFDPRHEREDGIFEKLGYIDVQNFVDRINAEVYMATGLMDEVCPPSTQFASYNKITSTKQMAIYPDFGHENLPEFNDMAYEWIVGKR